MVPRFRACDTAAAIGKRYARSRVGQALVVFSARMN